MDVDPATRIRDCMPKTKQTPAIKDKRDISPAQIKENANGAGVVPILPLAANIERTWVLCLFLAALTALFYSQVLWQPFASYDDDEYVVDNSAIRSGVTIQTARWAITSTEHGNWHPLTWLSHAADYQFYALNPAGHHATSMLLHILNVILLFLLLLRATADRWRSLLVAALFALHPINVESVAWVSERKTVLSMFMFLLCIAAYGWYARQPNIRRYVLVAGIFTLGLAAKPMVVTLPCVLLLLDYWPLQRIEGWGPPSRQFPTPQRSLRKLIVEKLPLLALSAGASAVTIFAQRASIRSFQLLPFGWRAANAIYAYVMYLGKTFWPSSLAVYYPYQASNLTMWKVSLCLLVLVALSVWVWYERAHRYLVVGWLWFLGTLVPMIGIVQVGGQAMADRYAYLPLIGLLVACVWGVADTAESWHIGLPACAIAATATLILLAFLTWQQVATWRSSYDLWAHTVKVTKDNYLADDNLAYALLSLGQTDGALHYFQEAARLASTDPLSHWALAAYAEDQGHLEEAVQHYETVISNPENRRQLASAYLRVAVISTELGDDSKAAEYSAKARQTGLQTINALILQLEQAISNQPSWKGYVELGLLLEQVDQYPQARAAYQQALALNPNAQLARRLLDHLETRQQADKEVISDRTTTAPLRPE